MNSSHTTSGPQALAQQPIESTRGWSVDTLLEKLPNAKRTACIEYTQPRAIELVYERLNSGLPVVLTGLASHPNWDTGMFALKRTRSLHVMGGTTSSQNVPLL